MSLTSPARLPLCAAATCPSPTAFSGRCLGCGSPSAADSGARALKRRGDDDGQANRLAFPSAQERTGFHSAKSRSPRGLPSLVTTHSLSRVRSSGTSCRKWYSGLAWRKRRLLLIRGVPPNSKEPLPPAHQRGRAADKLDVGVAVMCADPQESGHAHRRQEPSMHTNSTKSTHLRITNAAWLPKAPR